MDKAHLPLRIERLPDGGFVVSETSTFDDNGNFRGPLFASTSIASALEFIARRLDPAALDAAKAEQAANAAAVAGAGLGAYAGALCPRR